MALFRFHRGSLADSLKTSIIVKDTKDLLEKIADWWEQTGAIRSCMYQWQIIIELDNIVIGRRY